MNQDNSVPSTRRLLEVDFFRGAAILVIFWNHLLLLVQTAGYLVRSPFRIHYGFSDSAAVFVFLSGLVSGIVYDKVLESKGFLQTQLKALRRAGQIYGGQLITLGVLVACAFIWSDRGSLDPLHRQLQDFISHPISEGFGLISLQSCLDYVDILPFYIVILMLVPVVLLGFRKHPVLTLLVSSMMYLVVQVFRVMKLNLWTFDWFVNPFAWQFLFILGLYVGFRRRNGSFALPRYRSLVALAAAIAVVSFVKIPWMQTTLSPALASMGIVSLAALPIPWIQKDYLEPVYLLHFVSLAYLAWLAAPKIRELVYTSIARPIVITGQHSLFLYCLATILDYVLTHYIVGAGGKAWVFLVAGLLGCCFIVGTAMAFWWRPAHQHIPLTPRVARDGNSSR